MREPKCPQNIAHKAYQVQKHDLINDEIVTSVDNMYVLN